MHESVSGAYRKMNKTEELDLRKAQHCVCLDKRHHLKKNRSPSVGCKTWREEISSSDKLLFEAAVMRLAH